MTENWSGEPGHAATTIAIACAMPILSKSSRLTPATAAEIISSGYFGLLTGAVIFGWLADRIGCLPVPALAIGIFAAVRQKPLS